MSRRFLLATALALATFGANAESVAYKIDPNHTVVLASWSHFGFSHPSANFGQASGSIVYDAAAPENSTVEVTLPMSGLDTFVPKLDEHLRSPDFFDAAQYPSATFRSTAVEVVGDGRLQVTGDLSLHGVTRPVALAVTLNKVSAPSQDDQGKIGFDATATLKRSQFGIDMYVPMVSDEVTLRITTEAHAEASQ